MTARNSRILVMAAAFVAGLALCFGLVLIVAGRLSAPVAQQIAAIGGPFKLIDPHLSGLTGNPAEVAAVAKAYRVYLKKVPLEQGGYTMDHTAIVYLMDKDGRFVSPFNLKRPTDAAAADLRRYL